MPLFDSLFKRENIYIYIYIYMFAVEDVLSGNLQIERGTFLVLIGR
jgi:hypothetical protein